MPREASKEYRNKLSKEYKEKYGANYNPKTGLEYEPNTIFNEIEKEQAIQLAQLLEGSRNELLIAYKDPKVKELVNYILAAIILENKRLTPPESFFPIKISRRYKSIDSLKHKMEQKDYISDYLGFKIIPESEHDIFYSTDPVLQSMIERREKIRKFVADSFRKLSKAKNFTFQTYCERCMEILDKLQEVFTDDSLKDTKY